MEEIWILIVKLVSQLPYWVLSQLNIPFKKTFLYFVKILILKQKTVKKTKTKKPNNNNPSLIMASSEAKKICWQYSINLFC